MSVSTTKIADFLEALAEKVHDLSSDSIRIALSNTAPASEASNPTQTGNGILANVTEIAYTNYADDLTTDRTLEGVTSDEASGTWTLDCNDFQISASGGTLATFRYIYVYNDTPTSPADPLILLIDLGQAINLDDGESITISIDATGLINGG